MQTTLKDLKFLLDIRVFLLAQWSSPQVVGMTKHEFILKNPSYPAEAPSKGHYEKMLPKRRYGELPAERAVSVGEYKESLPDSL